MILKTHDQNRQRELNEEEISLVAGGHHQTTGKQTTVVTPSGTYEKTDYVDDGHGDGNLGGYFDTFSLGGSSQA